MEDQGFGLVIAMVFLKCSVKDTAPGTVCAIPEEQDLVSDPFSQLMFLTLSWSVQRNSYMEIEIFLYGSRSPSCGPASHMCLAEL